MPRRPGRFVRLPRSAARIRAEVDEELRFDIEMRARDLIAGGTAAAAAYARAEREFGDLEATRHYCEELDMRREAEERRANYWEDLRSDLRTAWRAMRRTPVFATVVLLTLALGIGANTAVFSVVRRVLIEPLPFRAPEQLYRLYTVPAKLDGDDDKLSAVELAAVAQARTVAGVTQFGWYQSVTYADEHTAEPWPSVYVSPNFFDVLGRRPVVGRAFRDEDVATGAPPAVIISYQRWQTTFGGDRRAIGRTIELNGSPKTVVGVLPDNFVGPTFTADVLFPLNTPAILRSARANRSRAYRAVARIKPGVSLAQFQSELNLIRPRIQAQYPEMKNAGIVRPKPLHAAVVGQAAPVLLMVMVGAGVVLIVTCVNIAGLFLSRAVARRRELGVRAAIGAGRGRLVRQVLTESSLYGLAGGALGIALAFILKHALLALIGEMLPKMAEAPMSVGILAAAAMVSMLCGAAFGALPAIVATRLDVRDTLGDGGNRAASAGRGASRGSRVLVSAQIAFAVLLVVGAGLLTRTFVSLLRTELGYGASKEQLTFGINPTGTRYPDVASANALVTTLVDRLRSLPAVRAVGYGTLAPWQGTLGSFPFHIEGRADAANDVPSIALSAASVEYFSALGVRVRAGRSFNATDAQSGPAVAVVSESVARRFWPGTSPIGARVRIETGIPSDSTRVWQIVGVVGDVRQSVTSDIVPMVYLPAAQLEYFSGTFVVRATDDASTLIPRVKEVLHGIDPQLPLFFPRTLREILATSVVRQRLAMGLMASFAVLALLLAALGIYGVMSYAVLARAREFGIRSALGAPRRTILALVLRQGLLTAAAGIACGLAAAGLLSKLMSSLLVGVSPHDTLAFVIAPVALALVAIVACVVPARSAMRVQPVAALRVD